jgi:hypothetical protein
VQPSRIDSGRSSAWQRLLALPGFKTTAAFLGNEILMLATPWWPIPWAVPYFPIKAVGIPALALFEVVTLAAVCISTRTRNAVLRVALGLIVAGGATWLNWKYDPAPLLDATGRGNARAAQQGAATDRPRSDRLARRARWRDHSCSAACGQRDRKLRHRGAACS